MFMELSVENFGPIKNVRAKTKPLTIVIGKNNLGKSFLAQLIYSSLSLSGMGYRRRMLRREFPVWMYPFVYRLPIQPTPIKRAIKESPTEIEAAGNIIDIVTQIFSSHLSDLFKSILEQNFGTKTRELININFPSSKMKFIYNGRASISFSISKRDGITTNLDFDKESLVKEILEVDEFRRILKKKRIAIGDCVSVQEIVQRALHRLIFVGYQRDKADIPGAVFYVPAGRAGLLESYDTVVSALVSLSPVAPLRGISMPPLPGMASQFYNTIMELRGRKGPMSASAERFVELLGGDIKLTRLREPKGRAMLSYVFRSNKKKRAVDIIHAASMVKELTPLYLIIRELVGPGDFLIIEEPESHLHPGAQLRLLEIFAELIRKGVQIIMTTHSDLMLHKVARLTGRHKLKKEKKEVSLDVDSVAIYWLKEERKGSVSREIKIGKYGSLEEIPTFDEAIKELYQEEISLQTRLQLEE